MAETTANGVSTPTRESRSPLYRQIVDSIEEGVENGLFPPGHRFPSETEWAASLGVSRITLRHALTELERAGLIERVVGRYGGTFVRRRPLDRDLSAFAGFSEQLRRQGQVAGARVLRALEVRAPGEIAAALECDEGAALYEIERLRLASGTPVLLERSFLPAAAFPGLLEADLLGSLYQLLEKRYGRRPTHARELLEPVQAGPRAARLLQVVAGTPLLRVERTAYDASDAPVEYASDLFLGDRTRMVVWSFDLHR